MLTSEEFTSLLTVGNTPVNSRVPVIPAEHSARLIALGYMVDLAGKLRMTTPGRIRIAAGQLATEAALLTNETPARGLARTGVMVEKSL